MSPGAEILIGDSPLVPSVGSGSVQRTTESGVLVLHPEDIEELLRRGTLLLVAAVGEHAQRPLPSVTFEEAAPTELRVDHHSHRVTWQSVEIPLSEREYQLVDALSEVPVRAWSYKELLRRVWGQAYDERDADLVRTAVKRLRKKLAAAGEGLAIESVRGFGFRLAQSRT